MATGYMGKILRVNLSSGVSSVEELPEEMKRQFIGGRGFGVKILFDELKPGIDPLSPTTSLSISAALLPARVPSHAADGS